MNSYVVELEQGVWIAPWEGDPGRTLKICNAKVFDRKSTAWRAIEKAQTIRPFKNAKVVELDLPATKAERNDNKNLEERFERKLIEVCGVCLTSSCWHGEFMCFDAKQAGTVIKPVSELRKFGFEHESNWSDENLNEIYGEPAPNGYKAGR